MPKTVVDKQGPVTVLTINRPEVHNCIDPETASSIAAAIEEFAVDDNAAVLVVTGAGQQSFSSGWDLKSEEGALTQPYFLRSGPLGFARLDPGKPTIAAVNGYCFAGGFELALWCDFRIAAGNAEFGVLNRRWGVPLIDGGTQRLARIAGVGTALYLITTGVRIGAGRALELNLVQEVTPAGGSLKRALELARGMSEYPQRSLRGDRTAALGGFGLDLDEGLMLERKLGMPAVEEPEMAEGIRRYRRGDRPEAPR